MSQPPTKKTLHYWSLDKKSRPAPTPAQQDWLNFYKEDPWHLLKEAIEGNRLTATQLGRVFYHMAHQRGFPENLLKNIEGSDDAKTLKGGNKEEGTIGAEKTDEKIKENEYSSLGHYLASLAPEHRGAFVKKDRIRNRFTYRRMYIEDFKDIIKTQKKHHIALQNIEDEEANLFVKELRHTLFYQFPIRSPLPGKCTFETEKPRTQQANPIFEKFRLCKIINTLKLDHINLTTDERKKTLAFAQEKSKNKKAEFTIKALKKHLNKIDAHCNYDKDTKNKDTKIKGLGVEASLIKIFGKENWNNFEEKQKEDRFHALYQHASNEEALKGLGKEWSIEENTAQWKSLLSISFPKGTANLSEKALKYLLPWVKKGYNEHQAALLGTVKKAFGHNFDKSSPPKKPKHWNKFTKQQQEAIETFLKEPVKNPSLEKPNHWNLFTTQQQEAIEKYQRKTLNFDKRNAPKNPNHWNDFPKYQQEVIEEALAEIVKDTPYKPIEAVKKYLSDHYPKKPIS